MSFEESKIHSSFFPLANFKMKRLADIGTSDLGDTLAKQILGMIQKIRQIH